MEEDIFISESIANRNAKAEAKKSKG